MLRITCAGALALFGCLAGVANAQEGATDAPVASPPPAETAGPVVKKDAGSRVRLSIRAFGAYEFETDTDDGDASYSVGRAGGGATLAWSVSEALSLSFEVGYDYSDYNFDNFTDIVPVIDDNDPFDDFQLFSLSVSGLYRFDETWSLLLGGFARAGWETGADVSDAWTGGGYGAVGFRISENLSLGFGIGASSQHDDDAFVFPVITIRWQINEKLLLESQRLGARLTYTLAEDVDLYARAEYFRREYRLADHEGIDEGVFRDTRVPVGIGVEWRPVRGLVLGVEGGAMVYANLRFYDSSNDRVARTDSDIAPYVSVFLKYTF